MATNVEIMEDQLPLHRSLLPSPPPFSSDCPRPDGNPCQLLRRELALLSAWIRARQHVITRNCTGEKGRKREKMDEQPRFFVPLVSEEGFKKDPTRWNLARVKNIVPWDKDKKILQSLSWRLLERICTGTQDFSSYLR